MSKRRQRKSNGVPKRKQTNPDRSGIPPFDYIIDFFEGVRDKITSFSAPEDQPRRDKVAWTLMGMLGDAIELGLTTSDPERTKNVYYCDYTYPPLAPYHNEELTDGIKTNYEKLIDDPNAEIPFKWFVGRLADIFLSITERLPNRTPTDYDDEYDERCTEWVLQGASMLRSMMHDKFTEMKGGKQ